MASQNSDTSRGSVVETVEPVRPILHSNYHSQPLCLEKKWGQVLLHWEARKLGIWESSDSHTDKFKWCGKKSLKCQSLTTIRYIQKLCLIPRDHISPINIMFDAQDHSQVNIPQYRLPLGVPKKAKTEIKSPQFSWICESYFLVLFFFQNWFFEHHKCLKDAVWNYCWSFLQKHVLSASYHLNHYMDSSES